MKKFELQDLTTREGRAKVATQLLDGDRFTIACRRFQKAHFQYFKSLEGKHCIFIYYDKAHRFQSFVACDTMEDALWKINDLARW